MIAMVGSLSLYDDLQGLGWYLAIIADPLLFMMVGFGLDPANAEWNRGVPLP